MQLMMSDVYILVFFFQALQAGSRVGRSELASTMGRYHVRCLGEEEAGTERQQTQFESGMSMAGKLH